MVPTGAQWRASVESRPRYKCPQLLNSPPRTNPPATATTSLKPRATTSPISTPSACHPPLPISFPAAHSLCNNRVRLSRASRVCSRCRSRSPCRVCLKTMMKRSAGSSGRGWRLRGGRRISLSRGLGVRFGGDFLTFTACFGDALSYCLFDTFPCPVYIWATGWSSLAGGLVWMAVCFRSGLDLPMGLGLPIEVL